MCHDKQIWALGKQALSAGMLVIDVEHGEVRPWPPETLDDLHSDQKHYPPDHADSTLTRCWPKTHKILFSTNALWLFTHNLLVMHRHNNLQTSSSNKTMSQDQCLGGGEPGGGRGPGGRMPIAGIAG